jgi:hypothetical protein
MGWLSHPRRSTHVAPSIAAFFFVASPVNSHFQGNCAISRVIAVLGKLCDFMPWWH